MTLDAIDPPVCNKQPTNPSPSNTPDLILAIIGFLVVAYMVWLLVGRK